MKYQLLATLVALLTSAATAFGQSTQRGFVFEYNDKMEKVPLGNVEIVVTNAASTVSDDNGEFNLRFRQLKPGDRIIVRRCIKAGYSIADESTLEHLYITGDDSQITILLCKTEKLQEVRRNIVRQATEVATNRYEADQRQLSLELNKKQITQEEYDRKLEELKRNYENKLDNIDNYIDRFVKLDLQALTADEKKIMTMVREGNFEKAIAAYEKLDLAGQLRRQTQNVERLEHASKSFQQSEQQLHEQRKKIRNAVFRQVDVLRIQGGAEAVRKADELLHDLAMVDTTNVYNMLVYARLLANYNQYGRARDIYNSLRTTAAKNGDSLGIVRQECYMAMCADRMGNHIEATRQLEHSLPLYDSLRRTKSDTLTLLRDEAEFCSLLAASYLRSRDTLQADHYFRRSLYYLRSLRVQTSLRDLDSQYANTMSIAAQKMYETWHDRSIQYCLESISIFEQLMQTRGPLVESRLANCYKRLAMIYMKQDKFEESEEAFLEAERHYRNCVRRNRVANNRFLAECLFQLAKLYCTNHMYESSIRCLEEAQHLYVSEPGSFNQFAERISDCNYYIGKCSYHLRDYQRALDCDLRALAEMEPLYAREPVVFYNEMGLRLLYVYNVYIRLRKYEPARRYIERAMEVDPNNPEIVRSHQEYIQLMNALRQIEHP